MHRPRHPRLLTGISVLAVAALALSGCSSQPTDSPAHTLQAENFAAVYAQTIDWGSCANGFAQDNERLVTAYADSDRSLDEYECAMITAPLDWNDPSNPETIELAATKLTATNDEPLGTLFVNPGGPGESALSTAYSFATWKAAAPITEAYDIIGIDPRGVGLSTPITCENTSAVPQIVYAECADTQPLARTLGTSQVARDHELVRTLEGDRQFNYLGYSYGTVLGATYATLFPDTVGTMMLDSAMAPAWATPLNQYAQMLASLDEMEQLLAGCGTEYDVAQCPAHSLEELVTQQSGAIGPNGEATGLFTTDGRELGGYDLYQYVHQHLYGSPAYRLEGLRTVGAAITGDQTASDEIAKVVLAGGASVQLTGQLVTCHSQPRDPHVQELVAAVNESGVPEMYGGDEHFDEFITMLLNGSCSALAEAGDDLTEFSGPADTTIVVVGITGDHATPYLGSEQLAAQLGNSSLVTLNGHGHGASFSERSSCIDELTVAFFLGEAVPADGTVCEVD